MNHATVRSLLLAVLVVGALGSIGPGTTYSLFTNTHDGTGTVTAADNVNGNSGGGNNDGVTADAGGPYSVAEDDSVQLDASASTTSNGNINSYGWTVTSGVGSLTSTSGETVTYEAPTDVDGDVTAEVEVTVSDGSTTDSATAEVTVSDTDSDNCAVSSLTFCSVDVTDRDTDYAVPYEVGDPSGKFKNVTVTLLDATNGNLKETVSAPTATDTLSVSDASNGAGDGNMNGDYIVRVRLYNTTGSPACTFEVTDTSDGTGPSVPNHPCGS